MHLPFYSLVPLTNVPSVASFLFSRLSTLVPVLQGLVLVAGKALVMDEISLASMSK
jgi:hypothetical protein